MEPSSQRPAEVRKLWAHERDAYKRHLLRLGPASRRLRFGGLIGDEALERYADTHFNIDGLTYGFVAEGEVRAAGELHGSFAWPRRGIEAAFSVEEGWRRRGIGAALFRAIVDAARSRGFQTVTITFLPENEAMRALVRKHGGDLRAQPCEVTGKIRLETANAASVYGEWRQDAAGLLDADRGR